MKDDEIKLLPCPFCGSKAEMVHLGLILRIRCTLCPVRMTYDGSDMAFEEMWNHRAQEKGIGNTSHNKQSAQSCLCDQCSINTGNKCVRV